MKGLERLDQEGLRLLNDGNYDEALNYFQAIIGENPNYEYGRCFYDLAICLEELGRLTEAETNYLKAIEYLPDDAIRLAGYASFLFLHGDTEKAFATHLGLLKLQLKSFRKKESENTMTAINELGRRMGMSEEEIDQRVSKLTMSLLS